MDGVAGLRGEEKDVRVVHPVVGIVGNVEKEYRGHCVESSGKTGRDSDW